MKLNKLFLSYFCLILIGLIKLFGQSADGLKIYVNRFINFNHPDGVYTNELLQKDFENGIYPLNRNFDLIENSIYIIILNKKIEKTRVVLQLKIKPSLQYTPQYKIKYAKNFQARLHGKQFGFDIGVGYDEGKEFAAHTNGDGGSLRIQFDSCGDSIYNRLYVYYCEMNNDFGNNVGNQHYALKWGG